MNWENIPVDEALLKEVEETQLNVPPIALVYCSIFKLLPVRSIAQLNHGFLHTYDPLQCPFDTLLPE